ncbi:glycosyltransferase family 4 protein [Photobacterium damselae]|uniref:glycosyltransferase family 4 protein n=1 Tax=Photobacterium damselae TaxID=38293 RepID=UPI00165DCE6A|nr:glycosyltransferase family 4 protein [Photobacterium damselae]
MKKNKIVLFTESMAVMGGMERVVDFLSCELSKENHVSILTMDGDICNEFKAKCDVDTLSVNIVPNGLINKIKRYIKTIYLLFRYLKKNDEIEYFIANSPALCCSTMLVSFCIKNKIKFVMFEHNKFSFPGVFWKIVRRLTFARAHKVIALTADAHYSYKSIGCPSVHIPNAMSISIEGKSNRDNKKLVAVGRLVYQKGFDLLLPAWKIVIEKHPDWVLEIVGEGEEEESLKKQSNNLGLSNNVSFYGKSTHVQNNYKEASGFILSSRYEGFGLVIVEAMAHGLPCVSFDCESGPNEIITNGVNGYLAKENDINDLADKIICYISLDEDEKNKMSNEALLTSTHYQPKAIFEQWKNKVFNEN